MREDTVQSVQENFMLYFEYTDGHTSCTKVDLLYGATHRVYVSSPPPVTLIIPPLSCHYNAKILCHSVNHVAELLGV